MAGFLACACSYVVLGEKNSPLGSYSDDNKQLLILRKPEVITWLFCLTPFTSVHLQTWANKSSTQGASSLGHVTGGTSASLSQEKKPKQIPNPNLLFKMETIPQRARCSVTQSSSHSPCLSPANLNSPAKSCQNWATHLGNSSLNPCRHVWLRVFFWRPSLPRTTTPALSRHAAFCLAKSSNNIGSYVHYIILHNECPIKRPKIQLRNYYYHFINCRKQLEIHN